jgi:hypothetical protein
VAAVATDGGEAPSARRARGAGRSAIRALGRFTLRALPPLRPLVYGWRARREAAQLDPASGRPAPVLVYQMGKVGSASVARALETTARTALHVHTLAPEEIARVGALHRRASGRFGIGYTWYVGRAVGERLRAGNGAVRLPVITLVRDPIAREVSAIFQSPALHAPGLVDARGHFDVPRVLAHLESSLRSEDACRYVFEWFAREIQPVLGIDVLAAPFDRERGYAIVEGDFASLLVLRTEDLDRNLAPALREFLGLELPPTASRANARSDGEAGDAYREVLARLRLPRSAAARIYAHPFVRHFYTDAMVAGFLTRWCGA